MELEEMENKQFNGGFTLASNQINESPKYQTNRRGC